MRTTTFAAYTRFTALLTAVAAACTGTTYASDWEHDQQLAQMAELHDLHATCHAAVSVHDPVDGDSPAVITQRVRDALSIWAEDGALAVVSTTATAGNYVGNGDPTIPRRALNPRAVPPPGANRAHCAHYSSISPEGYRRRTQMQLIPNSLNHERKLCKLSSRHGAND
jgi:hypothetical protein